MSVLHCPNVNSIHPSISPTDYFYVALEVELRALYMQSVLFFFLRQMTFAKCMQLCNTLSKT